MPFTEIVAALSLFVSLGAIGTALWMFDEQNKRIRIDNFVTRYIARISDDPRSQRDAHGFTTMLDAGVLWLRDSEEIREAIRRIVDCRVRQPFSAHEIGTEDFYLFFSTALANKESLGDMFSIIKVRMAIGTESKWL